MVKFFMMLILHSELLEIGILFYVCVKMFTTNYFSLKIENVLKTVKNGKEVAISHKCADIDKQVICKEAGVMI